MVAENRPLVPVRMLSEFTYCPRVMYLMWVEGAWADNPDTIDGRRFHRRVDEPSEEPPDPPLPDEAPKTVSSLELSDEGLGLVARLDLLQLHGTRAVPVEYKVGKGPPEGVWEQDAVQVAAQALLLRANGYRCDDAVVYYAGSRRRSTVLITDDLATKVIELRDAMWEAAERPVPPSPLVDSPKCPRCSLVGICLPDEVKMLAGAPGGVSVSARFRRSEVRRLAVARPEKVPLCVTTQGALIRKSGERLRITKGTDVLAEVRLADVSTVSVFGNVEVTGAAVAGLLSAGIAVLYYSFGGWFRGMTTGALAQNAPMRQAQYLASVDESKRLAASGWIVSAKIHNARLLIRRNAPKHGVLPALARASKAARYARTDDEVLGIEGNAARTYFEALGGLLEGSEFHWESRNRRPPRDPINALLSYLYALLLKDTIAAIYGVGLDPYAGLFHRSGYGKPALALDLMEAFRPVVADSTMLGLINRRTLSEADFIRTSRGTAIKDGPRRQVVEAYERRMDTLFEHPLFGYQVSYRRAIEIDARLLGRFVQGELSVLPVLRMR
jgi:CRISPR-associated protein Cas1